MHQTTTTFATAIHSTAWVIFTATSTINAAVSPELQLLPLMLLVLPLLILVPLLLGLRLFLGLVPTDVAAT